MRLIQFIFLFFTMIGVSCNSLQKEPAKTKIMTRSNPVVYFEIPVADLERAEKFYTAVFNFTFEKEIIDSYVMGGGR